MSLVKKIPPSPNISKVCAHNKELLCIGRGCGQAGGHLFHVVKSYLSPLVRLISNGWIWGKDHQDSRI